MRLSRAAREAIGWQERAWCRSRNDDAYFPETKPDPRVKHQCKVACPVRQECLDYALARGLVGIWGGTSTKERQAMRPKLSPDRLTA